MRKFKAIKTITTCFLFLLLSCKENKPAKLVAGVDQLDLKRGDIISCGLADHQFGTVHFNMSCNDSAKNDFDQALALLHSFEYDEAEKAFAKVIDGSPDCAMAYWGVAMANYHPLWSPPTEAELKKGNRALEIARAISKKSEMESDYIDALTLFYKDWAKADHHTRSVNYEKGMEHVHQKYPADKEAAIFYALSLDAAAVPTDLSYSNQRKAAIILNELYKANPDHPGIIHYIIHTYDYPGLAAEALPAARRYAVIAPSSAHALHMPSHIFTRLGLWDDCIQSNLTSVAAAKCYGESAGIKGHWDEELHGSDYLVYAYLQKGDNVKARALTDYVNAITEVHFDLSKVAYAYAAIPSRMALENHDWKAAQSVALHPDFPWEKYPWQQAIVSFTRVLGAANRNEIKIADSELKQLDSLRSKLEKMKDSYKLHEVDVQIMTGEAWIKFAMGQQESGLALMERAAKMEDSLGKHPVTPGEVLPARELLGELFLKAGKNREAVVAFESALTKSPNRFNSLYGAAVACSRSGQQDKAAGYYNQLLTISVADSDRPELLKAKAFLKDQKIAMK